LNRACLLILALCCLCFALGAPWIFSFLMSPAALALVPANISQAASAQTVLEASAVLEQALWLGVGVVALFSLFWLSRKALLRRGGGTRAARTWDCGCQIGTPRIQYSAASFVEPLTRLFAVIVGVTRRHAQWGAIFPSRIICEFHISGGLLRSVFASFFDGARQVCDRLKIVQHGYIHIYILYILVVLVGLLVWGLA